MAYTRIHAIKTTLSKALAYIENPDKTDDMLLVSGYNCDPVMAAVEFEMTKELSKAMKADYTKTGGGNNLAYHMIQSFAPYDNISVEDAHELGKRWADEILNGKYEYVISTHIDKGHIHNHIIFNSTSFYDYKKYESVPYKTAALLRNISDRLCEEKGLHVIKDVKGKGKSHYEWAQKRAGTSWKEKIENIIDTAIQQTGSYEQFCNYLKSNNVEIQNATPQEGKHIKFRLAGQDRYTRGKTIGINYTRERIIERLAEPKGRIVAPGTRGERSGEPEYSSFDQKVSWQARQARIAETKELAAALLTIRQEGIKDTNDFEIKLNQLRDKRQEVQGSIKELDSKNQQYKNVARLLVTYNNNLPIYQQAQRHTRLTRTKFELKHESELAAFRYASEQLENLNVNTNVDYDKVLNLVKEQDTKVNQLRDSSKAIMKRIEELKAAHDVVKGVQQGELTQDKQGRDKRNYDLE